MAAPHELNNNASHDASQRIFNSFWMGGYEGADHLNSSGQTLDMARSNGHLDALDADYALLAKFGIRTIRESIGWRASTGLREVFDPARAIKIAEAARRHDLQVIWTLQHYGTPPGVAFLAPDFPDRFADFCDRVVRVLQPRVDGSLRIQPINEISFLSWAASDTSLIYPYTNQSGLLGYDIKCALVRAALMGCRAIWATAPDARIVHTDPVVHVHCTDDNADEIREAAARQNELQFQAWDMIGGRLEPSLGGGPRYLDILGLNYYHGNQWEHPSRRPIDWHLRDPRRRDPFDLINDVWQRYRRPLLIAETGHVGDGRGLWLEDMGRLVARCRQTNVPLEGICLYPLIDRPDWEATALWHHSGLWDVDVSALQRGAPIESTRRLHTPAAQALQRCQRQLDTAQSPLTLITEPSMTTLIVFSHLRWDFVYQRPQHLLSRLANHYSVLFVEEPVTGASRSVFERLRPANNVEVLRPHLQGDAPGFHDDNILQLRSLLSDYLREHAIDDYCLWFYTPMALPLATELSPEAVVYDCMDELSAFRHAPRQLLQRENALFKLADLVFTGGKSLYERKKERHASVHCFPSSVDTAHFSPPAQLLEGGPPTLGVTLGYSGVIDERVSLSLIAALADTRPDWKIVMVGPVVKIDPSTLPRRPNIEWLGMKAYAELPALIGSWDICLLPFEINEATRFISPTKTLEYLAAGRPVVSTPINDVVATFSGIVEIADSDAAFIEACDAVLARDANQTNEAVRRAQVLLDATSWDRTAAEMAALIAAIQARDTSSAVSAIEAESDGLPADDIEPPLAPNDAYSTPDRQVVIIGAGPTGLCAALTAGANSVLLEQNSTVGGWCRSVSEGGFTFDYAGHIMFSTDPFVLDLYTKLLGDNLHWQNREAWIYSKDVYTRYPFQGALYGLPPLVLKECLLGAIEARFGELKKPPARFSPTGPSRSAIETTEATSATSASSMSPPRATNGTPKNFEEFIYSTWGAGVAKHFAIPYNKKLWAVPLTEMETSWLGGRVPLPDLEEMIEGALMPVSKPVGPNARFGYPLKGGFQALMDGFLPLLEAELRLDTGVARVSPSARTVWLNDGSVIAYNSLISTIPLPKLISAIGAEAPAYIREAARGLRHVSVRCVNLGIGRADVTDKHWIYYPEDTVFHRVFVQGNASPHCNPEGGFGLTCEITYSPQKPLPADGEALIQRCVEDCIRVGLIRADDPVLVANQVDMPYAYVVYDHGRAANVRVIREWLASFGIILAGRYSEWEYYNSDHAFVAGRKAALIALEQSDRAARASSAVA